MRQPDPKEFEDFQDAAASVAELLMVFDEEGMDKTAVLGGSLTPLIFHLLAITEDQEIAMKLLSECIKNATVYREAGPCLNIH